MSDGISDMYREEEREAAELVEKVSVTACTWTLDGVELRNEGPQYGILNSEGKTVGLAYDRVSAKLIVCAPEMLEVLKKSEKALVGACNFCTRNIPSSCKKGCSTGASIDAIAELIEKAEGK